jgi:hypothetical protein
MVDSIGTYGQFPKLFGWNTGRRVLRFKAAVLWKRKKISIF